MNMDADLLEAFEAGNVQLFVGSGLSHDYPSAAQFARDLLRERMYIDGELKTVNDALGEERGRPSRQPTRRAIRPPAPCVSLEDAAEYYERYAGPERLVKLIRRYYGTFKQPTNVHRRLWTLPKVRWIYTTNYDCMLEDAFGGFQQGALVVTRGSSLRDVPADRRVVFKPHGCARTSQHREEFVLTRDDYINYSNKRVLERLRTLYDVSSKVFLFLGYSLRDATMRHIISEAHRAGSVRAYAVMDQVAGPDARYWQNLGPRNGNLSAVNQRRTDTVRRLFGHTKVARP